MIIPEFTSLSLWAASLVVDFADDNIPLLQEENNWQEWGNILIQEPSFAIKAAPSTQGFADWQTWTMQVYNAMN